jgi:hypothetical protein
MHEKKISSHLMCIAIMFKMVISVDYGALEEEAVIKLQLPHF